MTATKSWHAFDEYLCLGGFGPVEHEHRFHPVRRWRFDWALPDQKHSDSSRVFGIIQMTKQMPPRCWKHPGAWPNDIGGRWRERYYHFSRQGLVKGPRVCSTQNVRAVRRTLLRSALIDPTWRWPLLLQAMSGHRFTQTASGTKAQEDESPSDKESPSAPSTPLLRNLRTFSLTGTEALLLLLMSICERQEVTSGSGLRDVRRNVLGLCP